MANNIKLIWLFFVINSQHSVQSYQTFNWPTMSLQVATFATKSTAHKNSTDSWPPEEYGKKLHVNCFYWNEKIDLNW